MLCLCLVCVPVLGSPVLCEAAPDRAAQTPATGIWYSPYRRVGELCGWGAQIPSNGEARKGKRARNMSRNRPCEGFHLEGIKKSPQLWEGQAKEDIKREKKRAEADGRSGASRKRSEASDSKLRNFTGFGFFTLLCEFCLGSARTLFVVLR